MSQGLDDRLSVRTLDLPQFCLKKLRRLSQAKVRAAALTLADEAGIADGMVLGNQV